MLLQMIAIVYTILKITVWSSILKYNASECNTCSETMWITAHCQISLSVIKIFWHTIWHTTMFFKIVRDFTERIIWVLFYCDSIHRSCEWKLTIYLTKKKKNLHCTLRPQVIMKNGHPWWITEVSGYLHKTRERTGIWLLNKWGSFPSTFC